jgi:hypothetical protein
VRGVNHTEPQEQLLDFIGMLNTIKNGGPINTQAPQLILLHGQMRGVKLSNANEREEEEGSLTKLELICY